MQVFSQDHHSRSPYNTHAPEVISAAVTAAASQTSGARMTENMSEKDNIYQQQAAQPGDFVFDDRVVRVFPDMIERSVPAYGLGLRMLGLLARRFVQPDSRVYDLGCSLGAATQAMRQAVNQPGVRFVAVDNSPDMLARCRQLLDPADGLAPVEFVEQDICIVPIADASLTVLNFTLQFVDPAQRLALLRRVAEGTRPGGALLVSEKIRFEDPFEQELMTEVHHDFKRARGYSDLEIARKRSALERVLQPDTETQHFERLREAGWSRSLRWLQAVNFVSYLAIR